MSLIPLSSVPTLKKHSSIKHALTLLESTSFFTIFVLSDESKLLGTVTDGDIRRSFLNNATLETSLDSVMNVAYKSVNVDSDLIEAAHLSKKFEITEIPLIDSSCKLCSVFASRQSTIFDIPVVIMAGGKGTRLQPLTNTCPKPMIPVNGKPMLEIVLERLISTGSTQFYISVNYLKEQIIDYFGDGSRHNISIQYLEEKFSLGTAGSLSLLPNNFDSNFLVINCDVLSLMSYESLYDFFKSRESDAVMCVRSHDLTVPFGVVNYDGFKFQGIQEKPTLNFMVNAGIYMFSPHVLTYVENSYLDMPDLFKIACDNGLSTHIYPLHEQWVDVGRHSALTEASQTLWT